MQTCKNHLNIFKCWYNKQKPELKNSSVASSSRSDDESFSETKIRLENEDEGYEDDGQGKIYVGQCIECIHFHTLSIGSNEKIFTRKIRQIVY